MLKILFTLFILQLCMGVEVPETIMFGENIVPESFVFLPSYYASNGSFVVGSITNNKLYLVSTDGEVRGFWPLPRGMEGSILGIELDIERDRILFCVSRLAIPQPVSTKGVLWSLKLPLKNQADGSTFPVFEFFADLGVSTCNDVVVDKQGNAYVSDTQNGRIIKVDSLGNWQPFLSNVDAPNGIEINEDYLLIGAGSTLLKYHLNQTIPPVRVHVLDAAEGAYDGIAFDPCNFQLSVNFPNQNSFNIMESDDDWETAHVVYHEDTGSCFNTASHWIEGQFLYSCSRQFQTGQNYSINSVPKTMIHFWSPENKEKLPCTICTRNNVKCYRP